MKELNLDKFLHIPSIEVKKTPVKRKELAIVQYLKKHGIEKTQTDFALKIKEYEFKIHLKYDQLNSPMDKHEVRECRGLVLAKTPNFQVLNYGFKKFFNFGEGNAATIDWPMSKILEKRDGSLILFYFDYFKQEWCVGTTGTAEGEGEVTNADTSLPMSFRNLFFRCLEEQVMRSDGIAKTVLNDEGMDSYIVNSFRKGLTYCFELTSPYNTIVTPHKINELRLLTVRNLLEDSPDYLQEADDMIMDLVSKTIAIPLVDLIFRGYETNIEKLQESFANMPFVEEGYVVVDNKHNRIKLKNPSYIEAHFLKHKQKRHQIIKVIKTNEIDEFKAAFPEKTELLNWLKIEYDWLSAWLDDTYNLIKETIINKKGLDFNDKKVFAEEVNNTKTQFISFFFKKHQDKIVNGKEYLEQYDDKKLYLYLMNGFIKKEDNE